MPRESSFAQDRLCSACGEADRFRSAEEAELWRSDNLSWSDEQERGRISQRQDAAAGRTKENGSGTIASADRLMNFDELGAFFARHGPQAGEPMVDADLVALDGSSVRLSDLWSDRPAVLVSASVTCPIARQRTPELAELLKPLGSAVSRGVLYTKEAHPVKDKAPHADGEWVTEPNEKAGILHRQPTTIAARLELGSMLHDGWTSSFPHFVDGMDDAVYDLFGTAANMGLLIDRDGMVHLHQGWLEPAAMAAAAAELVRRSE